MDWVQRPEADQRHNHKRQCFNPCCRGLGSETCCDEATAAPRCSSFNPCCRGLGSETAEPVRIKVSATMRFQSLLSWIGFRDLWTSCQWCSNCCVSILVVVDWVQRPPAAPNPESTLRSFNPCCRGLGSETRTRRLPMRIMAEFQSLLSWIGFRDSKLHVYANRIEVYVKFTRHVFFDEGAVLAC